MTETRTYSTKGYAIRAARSALKDKHADALSGVHFRLEPVGDEWSWHEIDVATGEVASGERVEDGVAAASGNQPVTEPGDHVVTETREQKRLRKIREADERKAARATAPKAPAAPKAPKTAKPAKEGGVVATKVAKLLELVKSPEGLTEPQLKSITGWSKFGGFYAAVKEAGLTMTRTKVDGVNVWKANAPTQAKAA